MIGGAFTAIFRSAADAAAMLKASSPAVTIRLFDSTFDIGNPRRSISKQRIARLQNPKGQLPVRIADTQRRFRQPCRKIDPVMFLQRCDKFGTPVQYQQLVTR